MTFSRRHAALSIPLFLGLAAGCAAGNTGRAPVDSSTVTAEDFEKRPGEPIENVLQAKVPGLIVRRTADGGIALQIRGASPFSDNNGAPLYVINGLPVEAGPDGALPSINPNDIESIKVLKGAETVIYGIQGANGVIVITTKKAQRK
ncbi:MAG: TonB-dependent receptor plug domain-containing protein [Longimicrobiales bacterium]